VTALDFAEIHRDYALVGFAARCELLVALDREDDTPTT
jgi:hypothetical protein